MRGPNRRLSLPRRWPRYRFSEKYSTEEDPAKPELITQYQVGVVETFEGGLGKGTRRTGQTAIVPTNDLH